MPLEASDVLIPITFGQKVIYKDAPSDGVLLSVALVYIAIYCFFAFRKFEREDL
jgi:hypothetical protein